MDVETLASRRAAAVVAALVVAAFAAYFVVAALVPHLFGQWPVYAVGALLGAAAAAYAVSFVARAADRGPLAWRVLDVVVAAVCILLDAQAVTLEAGRFPLRVTADSSATAFVHLLLWVAVVSTVVLADAGFRAVGDDPPEPVPTDR